MSAGRGARAAPVPPGRCRPRPAEAVLQLAAFAGLAAFVCGHWAAMVADPPVFRMALVVLIATGLAAALSALGGARLPRPAIHAGRGLAFILAAALALAAAGLPSACCRPAPGTSSAPSWTAACPASARSSGPTTGDEEWVRLVILLAAPPCSCWPRRWRSGRPAAGRGLLRALGLVALLVLYGIPVTEHDPGAPLVRGLVAVPAGRRLAVAAAAEGARPASRRSPCWPSACSRCPRPLASTPRRRSSTTSRGTGSAART